jgi:ureidoglycolate lyase
MHTALIAKPLSAEAFAPFGQVVEVDDHTPEIINDGNTQRFDSLAQVEVLGVNPYAAINIFRAQPRRLPLRITLLERHAFGSQSFQPLSGEPYLVLVANPVERPTPDDLHLFYASPAQGVNYTANTWHHPLLALNSVSDFLVVDRKGDGDNCEDYFFDASITITINV